MFAFVSLRGRALALSASAGLIAFNTQAQEVNLIFTEAFDDDPVAGGRGAVVGDSSRFVTSGGALTASYNTDLPTAQLFLPLGQTFTQDDSFIVRTQLTIASSGFSASSTDSGQINFGLGNTATTGPNRFSDSYDQVGVDFFPNITGFGGPDLGPIVQESPQIGAGYFELSAFPFGPESSLADEVPINVFDQLLTFELAYDAEDRVLTLSVANTGGPIVINGVGVDADSDATTIQNDIEANTLLFDAVAFEVFEVDAFTLGLFQLFPFAGTDTIVVADVTFQSIEVFEVVPEPGSIALLLGSAVLVLRRRRGT